MVSLYSAACTLCCLWLLSCSDNPTQSTTVVAAGDSWTHCYRSERFLALLTNFAGKVRCLVLSKAILWSSGAFAQRQVLQAAAIDGNNEYALHFEWTSPLSGQPSVFHTLKGVTAEQAMVSTAACRARQDHHVYMNMKKAKLTYCVQACITYGACLENKAYVVAQDIAHANIEHLQANPEQHAAASSLFRRAAGVYNYANTEFIQQLTSANQNDRYSSSAMHSQSCHALGMTL